jgi:Na+/H+ antiporter NhaD/arsenite permease-like protein
MLAAVQGGLFVCGVRVEFILFALMLLGVALFQRRTLGVALVGVVIIAAYKLLFTGFETGPGWAGLLGHLCGEWVTLANLLGLLLGFEVLAHHFSASKIPALLPRLLPAGWGGGFVLLLAIFALSSFLDNIAAALIGGTIAATVFKGRLHIGYLAAIVAAANAGGAGSVVGDTTTTMMWIGGVHPLEVLRAYVAAGIAMVVCGVIAARQQHAFHPMVSELPAAARVDAGRVVVVVAILGAAIAANVIANLWLGPQAEAFPWIAAAVWLAIFAATPLRAPHWGGMLPALRSAVFLLSLVVAASLMPVETLPPASALSALVLGFASAMGGSLPLTKLALQQGGYDWGLLAYAVGFGGSMLWFGSSAGVALAALYPQIRSVGAWLRDGWHVAAAYLLGFFAMLWLLGWQPAPASHQPVQEAPAKTARP